MERHYYGCITTPHAVIPAAHGVYEPLPQYASVVVFDTAADRTAWIKADAANRFALTSKDARQLMAATLNNVDVRCAARLDSGVELPTVADCKSMDALIAAYTTAAAYCFNADCDTPSTP